MALRPNGSGLRDDLERVRVLGAQLVPPHTMQRSAVPAIGLVAPAMHADPTLRPAAYAVQVATWHDFATELRPKGIIEAFVKTCQRWKLSEQHQLILLGYNDHEFGREILRGRWLKVPQDVKDRTGYLLGISLGVGAIFDEVVEAELAWLNAPHPELNGPPMAVMLEGRMKGLMIVSKVVANERALR